MAAADFSAPSMKAAMSSTGEDAAKRSVSLTISAILLGGTLSVPLFGLSFFGPVPFSIEGFFQRRRLVVLDAVRAERFGSSGAAGVTGSVSGLLLPVRVVRWMAGDAPVLGGLAERVAVSSGAGGPVLPHEDELTKGFMDPWLADMP